MQLQDLHLSYCSNLHPGSTWEEIRSQLGIHIPELKKRLSPDSPFGIGLRLSAQAAEELLTPDVLDEFRAWLKQENLYVFTVNGFVYGHFHAERVKDVVYQPHWGTEERLIFTRNIIHIMAQLMSEHGETSISTSPISYKYWEFSDDEATKIAEIAAVQLATLAYEMSEIYASQHKLIHVDIEPEPDCYLETTDETIHFFNHHLLTTGVNYLAEQYQLDKDEAINLIKTHIQVCFDTCHVALEYENPKESIQKFLDAGIGIGKVQISSALKITLPKDRSTIANQLQNFVEPIYLHQVLARLTDGSIQQFRDLDVALNHIDDPEMIEWRVHYHVPVFLESYGELSSTQDDTILALKACLNEFSGSCNHFEIETYTWDVLPPDVKLPVDDSIERELRWAIDQINSINP